VDRALRELSPDALRTYHNELLWREFAHSTLFDRPALLEQPFREEWRGFPWRDDEAGWQAWAEGRTGYPVVDAAARQLLATGFVHNRARMISASFLAKHLLIDFRRGERHYFDLLCDGDWANNDMGWQWSAGCGCDAQPWFRIFNPVTQGQKFDPEGDYVRTWVPELAALPARYIHAPWLAPPGVRASAGVRPGSNYPRPIVEHDAARRRFLDTAKRHFGQPTT
jgi:deoxyribodipyrimidine photo-lyase